MLVNYNNATLLILKEIKSNKNKEYIYLLFYHKGFVFILAFVCNVYILE
jgi:hypothetical protein